MDYPNVNFYLMGFDLHDTRAQVEADCPICSRYIVMLFAHSIKIKTYICPGCNTEMWMNVFAPLSIDRWDLVGYNAPDNSLSKLPVYEGAPVC